MLERVKTFANEMLGRDEESDAMNSHTDSERQKEQPDNGPNPALTKHEELMKNLKSVAFSTSADFLQNILRTSMCLEKADKGNIKDAVSDARKAKSLIGRWLESLQIAGKNDVANKLPGETLIEEDTVVLAEMVVERGRSSAKALKQYRAIDIHDKYYNKWSMTKVPQKTFRKDSKYKLKVRMQEISAVQEYGRILADCLQMMK